MKRGIVFIALAVFVGIVTAWMPALGIAQDQILGPVHKPVLLPGSNASKVTFRTVIEVGDRKNAGYVPVIIQFDALGTLPADRRLLYRFESLPSGETPPRRVHRVDVPIFVEQGTKKETFVRYLPKWTAGQRVDISVLEDGRVVDGCNAGIGEELRQQQLFSSRFGVANFGYELLQSNEHWLNWGLILEEDSAEANDLAKMLMSDWDFWRDLSQEERKAVGQLFSASGSQILRLSELPTDWRGYQNHDAIAISDHQLDALTEVPIALAAIRDWTLNGGVIVVYDSDSPADALERLRFRWTDGEEMAEQVAGIALKANANVAADLQGTREYLTNSFAMLIDEEIASEESGSPETLNLAEMGYDAKTAAEARVELDERIAALERAEKWTLPTPSQWKKKVWIQNVGAGRVVLMSGGGCSQTNEENYEAEFSWRIARKAIDYRVSPMIRRGIDPLIGSRRFSHWLIRGVAQPPVYTFMVLLTVFVVLVGPVAYRQTAKRGRSYLMFAIAPLLAVVTTLLMFGYGIVSDGFGTTVRVRQLTWVDGDSGDAGERTRATYFAGVRPSDGLTFPGDAEVMGYPNSLRLSWEQQHELEPTTPGRIVVQEDKQVFDSSFLPSRDQRQFVTHRPRRNVGALKLVASRSGGPPTAISSFGFALREAVVRDAKGEYWKINRLSAGATQSCEAWPKAPQGSLAAKNRNTPSQTLGRFFRDYRPLAPTGQRAGNRRKNPATKNHTFDLVSRTTREIGDIQSIPSGIFENQLERWLQRDNQIPKLHFVAIADVSRDVVAVQACEIVESIRYVFGTLR